MTMGLFSVHFLFTFFRSFSITAHLSLAVFPSVISSLVMPGRPGEVEGLGLASHAVGGGMWVMQLPGTRSARLRGDTPRYVIPNSTVEVRWRGADGMEAEPPPAALLILSTLGVPADHPANARLAYAEARLDRFVESKLSVDACAARRGRGCGTRGRSARRHDHGCDGARCCAECARCRARPAQPVAGACDGFPFDGTYHRGADDDLTLCFASKCVPTGCAGPLDPGCRPCRGCVSPRLGNHRVLLV